MKDLKDDNLCSNGGDLLAYLYREMPAGRRDTFELHLADCAICIDDFAELSQGRYPVFEWKALEFDAMPTPRFVMPLQPAAFGFFDRLRAAFAIHRGITFGGAAAAALVALLAGYAIYFQSGAEPEVAEALPEHIVASPIQRVTATSVAPDINSTSRNEIVERDSAVAPKNTPRRPVPVKAAAARTKPVIQTKTLEVRAPVQPRKQIPAIPVLSLAEDDEDESLRLTDLFEDIGASE